jgi:hypothetical protein
MTSPRRNGAKRTRKNVTGHRRALADPDVAKLIAGLRKRWKAIDGIERGDHLRELTNLGCSRRGLGKGLRQSATTIRRHIELAALPIAQRRAVEAGASAKKILADKAILDRQRRRKKRIDDNRKTGALSDEVADIILEFCRAGGNLPLTPILEAEITEFMSGVAINLSRLEVGGQPGIKATKRLGIAGLFEQAQPPANADTFWMDYQAEWLANIVLAKAPEHPIWEDALEKAKRRACELKAKDERTPSQAYKDRLRHIAEIEAGPAPRPYRKGASSMRKQGLKPVS